MPTCSICKLFVNSEAQMVAHRTGKIHLTKLKALGMNPDIMDTTPVQQYNQQYYGGSFVKQEADQGNYGGMGDGGPTFMSSPVNNNLYADPVSMAVQDNAYGRIPTKRKAVTSRCQACSLSFNSTEQASSHYLGSKHAKKLRATGDPKALSLDAIPKNAPPGPKQPVAPCEICSVSFTSELQADAHYKGSKHARHLTAKDTGVTSSDGMSIANFNCPLCNVSLNSQGQYEAHIAGSKHIKLLEKKTSDVEARPSTTHVQLQ